MTREELVDGIQCCIDNLVGKPNFISTHEGVGIRVCSADIGVWQEVLSDLRLAAAVREALRGKIQP